MTDHVCPHGYSGPCGQCSGWVGDTPRSADVHGPGLACSHERVLQLPPFGMGRMTSLQLRQCDACKRIGIVDNYGETRWMEEKP